MPLDTPGEYRRTLGRAAQTNHRLPLWGPNGPLGRLEQLPAVGVSEPHYDMQADAEEDRPNSDDYGPGDARCKQDRGNEHRSNRHHEAVPQEAVHGLALDRSRHAGVVTGRPGDHIVYRSPKVIASTARARPALTHGLLARFQRPIWPSTRRLLTAARSMTKGAMYARL
jgi:hypothetical protein